MTNKVKAPKPATAKTPLPVAEWPDADRSTWLKAKAPADIFGKPHRGTDWAPASWRKAEVGYGRWLRWLTLHHPEQLTLPPEARLTEGLLRGWNTTLAATLAPMSQLSLVEDVSGRLGLQPLAAVRGGPLRHGQRSFNRGAFDRSCLGLGGICHRDGS